MLQMHPKINSCCLSLSNGRCEKLTEGSNLFRVFRRRFPAQVVKQSREINKILWFIWRRLRLERTVKKIQKLNWTFATISLERIETLFSHFPLQPPKKGIFSSEKNKFSPNRWLFAQHFPHAIYFFNYWNFFLLEARFKQKSLNFKMD